MSAIDRLTRLLIDAGVTWEPRGVATDLIESGAVIVPPCKIGDTVYVVNGDSEPIEKQVIGLHLVGEGLRLRRKNRSRESYIILRSELHDEVLHVPVSKLGETLFTTTKGGGQK